MFGDFECAKMPTTGERALSEDVMTLWADLARHGSPGSDVWPSALDAKKATRELLLSPTSAFPNITIEVGRDSTFCDFWDRNTP